MRVTLYEKIFVWAIATEPLLFFVLSHPGSVVSLTLSRVLQIIFLTIFLIRSVSRMKVVRIRIPNAAYILLSFAVLSSFIGIFSGSYDVWSSGVEVPLLTYVRPLFELFILVYYILFFIVLPQYILREKNQVEYLLNSLIKVVYVMLIVGLVDYLVQLYGYFVSAPIDLIPRHLVDSGWVHVGYRFHSFLGEPRDAFVYLLFAAALLQLGSRFRLFNMANSTTYILFVLFSLVLTQTFSGIFGLLVGVLMVLFFGARQINFSYVYYIFLPFMTLITVYLLSNYSDRIAVYVEVLLDFFSAQQHGNLKDNHYLYAQSADLIPLYLVVKNVLNYDVWSLFFGSGSGSASFAVNNFFSMENMSTNNPRSQFIRLIFEFGLVGLYFYLIMLVKPIYRLKYYLEYRHYVAVLISALVLYGGTMGHRSHLGFIFAGLVLAYLATNKIKER